MATVLPALSRKLIEPSDAATGVSPGEFRAKVNEEEAGSEARARKVRKPEGLAITFRSTPGSKPATSARPDVLVGRESARPALAPGASARLITPLPVSTLTKPVASSGAPTSTGAGVFAALTRPLRPDISPKDRSIGAKAAPADGW